MSARIRSLRNAAAAVDEASRDDLVAGDVVTVSSLDAATTYLWTLIFVPEGSTATFSGDISAVSPGSFTIDLPGAYLVRLIVDQGLGTEDDQYVRLRAVTTSLGLKLVAAGERRDSTGTIPVDSDPEGWANDQNSNLLALETAVGSAFSLALTLAEGNATGGTNLLVSTSDEIQGQTTLTLRADNNASDHIELRPGSAGVVKSFGLGFLLVESAAPSTPAATGALFVSDGSGGLDQNDLYFRPASDGTPVRVRAYKIPYHLNFAPVANGTVNYKGWAAEDCTLVGIRAYMSVLGGAGAYDLTVTNEATGNTCLSSTPFDMNGLSADTVTSVSLTGTTSDLAFSAEDRWTVTLTSDNPAFAGSGIYIELLFEV